ncbi:MAG: urocanate hydratase [Nitrososphaerota archaeon]
MKEEAGVRPLHALIEEGYYEPSTRTVRAIKGWKLHCVNWQVEGVLRMLFNVLDPSLAKDPKKLIVYGGRGKAARNWECFEAIVDSLLTLREDETLLVQSGKPVAIFRTGAWAPRALICNSMLVGRWATWEHFEELEAKGLIMYGQYTAGSWNFIGLQGILQGTFETFAAVADRHFGGTLKGRLVLSAGLGAMGGAQPLAITMNEGVALIADVDEGLIRRRAEDGWLDRWTQDVEQALAWAEQARAQGRPLSVGLVGNAAEVYPQLLKRGVIPDVVTDQTPAHDPLSYVPEGLSPERAEKLRVSDPQAYAASALRSMKKQVEAILGFMRRGAVAFEYGNNIRRNAAEAGLQEALSYPGFIQAYLRPMLEEGRGPFRWASLVGEPEDIHRLDEVILSEFGHNARLARWINLARRHVRFQGLPARVCWLGFGERARFGKLANDLVARGVVGPIWVGRDHLDSGSVASPYRETEGMRDGSDAVADWPILNALLNTAAGATWVAVHQGGGQGMGFSISAGFGMVLDGTKEAEGKALRLFEFDPGIGVVRHADAGYEKAIRLVKASGIRMPMLRGQPPP